MLDVIYRITFVQAKFPKAIVFLSAHNYILRMKKAKIWKHVKCLVCDHHFFYIKYIMHSVINESPHVVSG